MTQKQTLGVLATAGILMLGSGVAYAAIPNGNGVFNGCVGKLTGILRVIDSAQGQRCLATETSIIWNQTGPQGPTGPAGSQGPAGPQGPAGVGASGPVVRGGDRIRIDQGPSYGEARAVCEPGEIATGGGFTGIAGTDWSISVSVPAIANGGSTALVRVGQQANAWWIHASPRNVDWSEIYPYVLCMKVN